MGLPVHRRKHTGCVQRWDVSLCCTRALAAWKRNRADAVLFDFYFQKHYFKFQEQRRRTFQRIRPVWQPRAAANTRVMSSKLLSRSWRIKACMQNRSTPASYVVNNEGKKGVWEGKKAVIMPKAVRKSSNKSFKIWYFVKRKVLFHLLLLIPGLSFKSSGEVLRKEWTICVTAGIKPCFALHHLIWFHISPDSIVPWWHKGHRRSLNEVKHEAYLTARVAVCSFCKQPHVTDRTQG